VPILQCLLDGVSRPERPLVPRAGGDHPCRAGAVIGSASGHIVRCALPPCRLAPPPFVRAVAYGLYQDRMKQAIHALKYDRLHPAARRLGRMLAEAIAQLAAEAPADNAGSPSAAAPVEKRSARLQPGSVAGRGTRLGFLRKTHPEWRLTLAPSTLMRLRATESQAGLTFASGD